MGHRTPPTICLDSRRVGRERERRGSLLDRQLKAGNSTAQRREAPIECCILNRLPELGKPNCDAVVS